MAVFQMNFLAKSLGQMTNITVILPSFTPEEDEKELNTDYRKGMKFQALWLLHGFKGDDSQLIKFTNIVRYAEENKLAVILPNDYNHMYTDTPNSYKFFTYIVEELPQIFKSYFPISTKREDNFIGGITMGAEGAMKAALRYPQQYSSALIISDSFKTHDFESEQKLREKLFSEGKVVAIPPDDVPPEEFDLTIPAKLNVEQGKDLPKFIMAWGQKDKFAAEILSGAKLLQGYGYDVVTKELDGCGHDWDCWDLALKKAIYEWLPIKRKAIYVD